MMAANNRTNGYLTPQGEKIRQELYKYIYEEHPEIINQDASLNPKINGPNHGRWWEYSTAIELTSPQDADILDVGGMNNIIGWFLRDKRGCRVSQIGVSKEDEKRFAQNIAKQGDKNIWGKRVDIRDFDTDKTFDIIYSISVVEHVRELYKSENCADYNPSHMPYWTKCKHLEEQAAKAEANFMKAHVKFLKPGGLLCMTFEYKKHGDRKAQNRCAYLRSPEDIMERIIKPTGLKIVGDIDYETIYPLPHGVKQKSNGIILLRKED